MVLDFGCGCGRNARRLALAANPMPKRYVGLDLHAGMIEWCNQHLAPALPRFTFAHQNIYNPGFNPDPTLPRVLPFPVASESVTLLIATSVFTHLLQDDAEFYLDEVRRALHPDGVMIASFFFFEKRYFPMMQTFQNALYINPTDPCNAVMFDRDWLQDQLRARGLGIAAAQPPEVRGFQWSLEIRPGEADLRLAEDRAPFGSIPPPVSTTPPHLLGA